MFGDSIPTISKQVYIRIYLLCLEHSTRFYVKIFRSKGGRTRTINAEQLLEQGQAFVSITYQYFSNHKKGKDRLFISKAESYIKAFARARKLVTADYTQCGVHSLRREFANDFFDREIEKGRNKKEVKQELTLLLGHKRIDVLKHYLQ